MLGRWRREGDFNKIDENGTRRVSFVADSIIAIITRIDFTCNYNDLRHQHDLHLKHLEAREQERVSNLRFNGLIELLKDKHNGAMEGEKKEKPASKEADIHISLTFSPHYADELIKVCNKLNIRIQSHVDKAYRLNANRNQDCEILEAKVAGLAMLFNAYGKMLILKLFAYFNNKNSPHPFPQDLISEIENIYKAVQSTITIFRHIINDDNKYLEIEHTDDSGAEIISLCIYPENYESYIRHLLEGDDPNKSSDDVSLPIIYSITHQPDERMTELLLFYKANPFLRPYNRRGRASFGINSFSAFENALAFRQHKKADIIINKFSEDKRWIKFPTPQEGKIRVVKSSISSVGNSIVSLFYFNNEWQITTRFIHIKDLTKDDKAEVYRLFQKYFEMVNVDDNELRRIFDRDFSDNKYIDIIYNGTQMIGFNLFEIISDHHNNTVFVHCAYGGIDREYRGSGLMIFLSFRLAYTLQLIMPEKSIGFIFCSLHYNSYRMVDFEHYPKYQSDTINKMVTNLLDAINKSQYKHYHHLLTSYVVENIRVRAEKTSRTPTLNERIYNREILGYTSTTEEEPRYTPVTYLLGQDNYLHSNKVAFNLGISQDEHLADYAKHIHAFIGWEKPLVVKFSIFMRRGGSLLNNRDSNERVINKL